MIEIPDYIKNLKPYQPGKAISETQKEFGLSQVIKLASNENPIGISEKVLKAMSEKLKDSFRYPEGSQGAMIDALSKKYQISESQICLGNGSNELINLLIQLACRPDDKILTFQYAFVAYKISAQTFGIQTDEVICRDRFEMDMNDLLGAIGEKHKLIFLPNPNNPTGRTIPQDKVREFLEKIAGRPLLLVLDDAYSEFADDPSALDAFAILREFPENVVVLKTFSKVFGLAGLRVGALFGNKKIINYVHRIRNPFNTNIFCESALPVALSDVDFVKRSRDVVVFGRNQWMEGLRRMGLDPIQSQANFILVDCKVDCEKLHMELLKRGVILRPMKPYGLNTYMRISIGTRQENELAIKVVADVLKAICEENL
ncbi:MAG: histidinol-phosphate transaminase [Bdellovibrionales bacterium CG10_big_fil_rev_8_21_14_0_10_45_34]|nr:MAG: histidinol-phosphate transaminase [Bdellovibrionales bacterium CG10_big_fil_rev_8_21_14_0_10_45_34]